MTKKQNLCAFLMAVIIAIIAILVYKGTVRFLDTPFGFVREQLFNIHVPKMFEVALHIALALFLTVVFLKLTLKVIRCTKFLWYL